MPGIPHEVLIAALSDRPALVQELVRRITGEALSEPVAVLDSTVRVTKAIEVRPDLVLRTRLPAWTVVEIQNRIDERKRRSWPLAVSQLFHQEKVMGELIVVTASRRVASWAKQAAHVRGEAGTRLELTPLVVLLAGKRLEALLDPAHPELALFAAWAMHDRRGPEARRVVKRSIELVEELPEPLQDAQIHAILSVLSGPMLAFLREMAMDVNKIPESPAARRFRLFFEKRGKVEGKAEGKVEGKQEALLAVFAVRGLPVTEQDRSRIHACMDAALLDRWIKRAVTTTSVSEALEAEPVTAAQRAKTRPAAKATGRRSRRLPNG